MKISYTLAMILAALSITGQARAAIVTFYISGVTDSSYIGDGVDGNTFTGSFSYDTATVGQSNATFYLYGLYYNTGTINLKSGAFSATQTVNKNGPVSGGVNVQDYQYPYADCLYIQAGPQYNQDGYGLSVGFVGQSTALTSSALPTSLDLSKFTIATVYYRDSGYSYSGTITSLSQTPPPPLAVPEPSVWAMMTLGMGAVGFALRRRQQGVLAYA